MTEELPSDWHIAEAVRVQFALECLRKAAGGVE